MFPLIEHSQMIPTDTPFLKTEELQTNLYHMTKLSQIPLSWCICVLFLSLLRSDFKGLEIDNFLISETEYDGSLCSVWESRQSSIVRTVVWSQERG